MSADILTLPEALDRLAHRIRADLEAVQGSRKQWIEGSVKLAQDFAETRDRFPSNIAFGVWLVENHLDKHNDQDRAALISFGRNPELARLVFEETDRISYQHIWDKDVKDKDRFSQMRKTEPQSLVTPTLPETTPKPAQTPQEPSAKHEAKRPQPNYKPKKASELHNKHGKTGADVFAWLTAHRPPGSEGGMPIAKEFARLKPATIKELARFISTHNELRAMTGTKNISPKVFWREMPMELVRLFEQGVPTKTGVPQPNPYMLAIIKRWDELAAPIISAWLAAGEPPEVKTWYAKNFRPVSTAPISAPIAEAPRDLSALLSAANVSEEMKSILDPNRPYENDHQGFLISHQGDIRAYGAQIWPRPVGARWSFRDAFYAFHLWHSLDNSLAPREPRAHVRARELMNPFCPIMTNINGAVGAVLSEILGAQHYHPERQSDTVAPPKRLNIARE